MYRHLTTDGLREADSVVRGETLAPERAHSIALMTGESANRQGDGGNVLDARGAAHRREIAAMQLYQVLAVRPRTESFCAPRHASQLALTRCFGPVGKTGAAAADVAKRQGGLCDSLPV